MILKHPKNILFCLALLLLPSLGFSWLQLETGGEAIGDAQGKTKETYGRLNNGTLLPEKGPGFVRVGGARINWGTGHMVSLLTNASEAIHQQDPDVTVHIGGISFEHGGKFPPHKSHQNGLDADILFMGRTTWDSVIGPNQEVTEEFDPEKNWEFWRMLTSQRIESAGVSEPVVAMILVSPPIKRHLCQWARSTGRLSGELDREVMRRIRATEGHDGHFHLRLHCSPFHKKCLRTRLMPSQDDGCEEPLVKVRAKKKKKKLSSSAVEARS